MAMPVKIEKTGLPPAFVKEKPYGYLSGVPELPAPPGREKVTSKIVREALKRLSKQEPPEEVSLFIEKRERLPPKPKINKAYGVKGDRLYIQGDSEFVRLRAPNRADLKQWSKDPYNRSLSDAELDWEVRRNIAATCWHGDFPSSMEVTNKHHRFSVERTFCYNRWLSRHVKLPTASPLVSDSGEYQWVKVVRANKVVIGNLDPITLGYRMEWVKVPKGSFAEASKMAYYRRAYNSYCSRVSKKGRLSFEQWVALQNPSLEETPPWEPCDTSGTGVVEQSRASEPVFSKSSQERMLLRQQQRKYANDRWLCYRGIVEQNRVFSKEYADYHAKIIKHGSVNWTPVAQRKQSDPKDILKGLVEVCSPFLENNLRKHLEHVLAGQVPFGDIRRGATEEMELNLSHQPKTVEVTQPEPTWAGFKHSTVVKLQLRYRDPYLLQQIKAKKSAGRKAYLKRKYFEQAMLPACGRSLNHKAEGKTIPTKVKSVLYRSFWRKQNEQAAVRYWNRPNKALDQWFLNHPNDPRAEQQRLDEWLQSHPSPMDELRQAQEEWRYLQAQKRMDYENWWSAQLGLITDNSVGVIDQRKAPVLVEDTADLPPTAAAVERSEDQGRLPAKEEPLNAGGNVVPFEKRLGLPAPPSVVDVPLYLNSQVFKDFVYRMLHDHYNPGAEGHLS